MSTPCSTAGPISIVIAPAAPFTDEPEVIVIDPAVLAVESPVETCILPLTPALPAS